MQQRLEALEARVAASVQAPTQPEATTVNHTATNVVVAPATVLPNRPIIPVPEATIDPPHNVHTSGGIWENVKCYDVERKDYDSMRVSCKQY